MPTTDFMFTQFVMCAGCPKAAGWDAGSGIKCSVYKKPHVLHYARNRSYCPFNPPVVEAKKKGFVNPLKASKRGA